MARVLGLSCDYHDSAAALCVDGAVVAAVEEERLSRVKHDSRFPHKAIGSCLAIGDLSPDDLDAVVFYEKPLNLVGRWLASRQRVGPRSWGTFVRDVPRLVGSNLMVGDRIDRSLRTLGATRTPPVAFAEHHLSHAAAAFFPSPFDTAAIMTVDGVGEWATASVGRGGGRRVELHEEIRFPHSLGLLYSLMTRWCGFAPNDGEYKLMGLAPFGSPRYLDALEKVLVVSDSGGFTIDSRKVGHWSGPPTRLRWLIDALDGPPLPPGAERTEREADIAASVQALVETAVLGLARRAHDLTGESRLCLAGGVALNCVANARLADDGLFDEIWVQPAAGDAGSAIGAALWFEHQTSPRTARLPDAMSGGALGPRFSSKEIEDWLEKAGVAHRRIPDTDVLVDLVAARLADGEIVGWCQGRMEFGPRALGNRSILADPRSETVQDDLNVRIKGRERFRPFAPSVLAERAADWFALEAPSPYMLRTAQVAPGRDLPGCTHIDGSARVQTVDAEVSPLFHALLSAFERETGCPVLLNTSFNVADEPIVCTPADAFDTARRANLDLLIIEDVVVDLGDAR